MKSRRALRVAGVVLVAAFLAFASQVSPRGARTVSTDVEIDAQLGESMWPGEAEATRSIAELIARTIEDRYPKTKRPARRDAHPKAHGCVRAAFTVDEVLPPTLAQGVFVPGKIYPAWIRFSNGNSDPERPDVLGDARGMAMKLMGVPGAKLLPEESTAETQDFIMINHPVFFIDEPGDYLTLIKRSSSTNPLMKVLAPFALGLKGAMIARAITKKRIENPLYTRFWSSLLRELVLHTLACPARASAFWVESIECGASFTSRSASSATT